MKNTENTAHIGIDSEIGNSYKIGDHIFTADFCGHEDGNCDFDYKEYEIKKVQTKFGKKDYSEIIDIRFPKSIIKTDLKTGYFKTKKDAAKAFIDSIEFILNEAKEKYSSEFEGK